MLWLKLPSNIYINLDQCAGFGIDPAGRATLVLSSGELRVLSPEDGQALTRWFSYHAEKLDGMLANIPSDNQP